MTELIRRPPQESPNGQASAQLEPDSRRAAGEPSYPFLSPPVESDEIGRLGNYRVLRLLGVGGMGFIFHAEDLSLGRSVALKVMKPDLDGDASGAQRFLREARAMASIKHESLVTVYQAARDNDVVYLAMELLEGESLEDWLAHVRRPDQATILRVARDVANGLAVIHQHGLVHRDIKLANLWMEVGKVSVTAPSAGQSTLAQGGQRVKILDFGLARFIKDDVTITQAGTVLGTPCFMSPEQARGDPVDGRSDLFSFGCVLYCLCTGTNPFEAHSISAVLTALALHDPAPVHQINPAIPKSLSILVTRLLDKDPQNRPASAEEVLEYLRQIESRPIDDGDTVRQTPASHGEDPYATRPLVLPKRPSATRKRASGARKKRQVRRRWQLAALAIVLSVLVVGVLLWFALPRRGAPSDPSAFDRVGKDGVYLIALNMISQENWPWLPPHGPGMPPINALGGIRVQGKELSHGIFMHPPPPHEGAANLTYRLGKNYTEFSSEVSLNDGPGRCETPVTFAVYGDGQLLWRSRGVSSQADRQVCTVSVEDMDLLTIEVRSAGDPRGAHAVWIDPYLERKPSTSE
jgi:eukaryotic-like serine/threonine-protein kinase